MWLAVDISGSKLKAGTIKQWYVTLCETCYNSTSLRQVV